MTFESKRAMIEAALPYLSRIPILFFTRDFEEVEEFAAETGFGG